MRILGQSPVVSSTISSQDRAIPECDASHPVRIINIESDTSKSVEGITPTFEIRVKVEGRSEVLTALLKQMQLDTCFAARVFSLAQEFADSHSLER